MASTSSYPRRKKGTKEDKSTTEERDTSSPTTGHPLPAGTPPPITGHPLPPHPAHPAVHASPSNPFASPPRTAASPDSPGFVISSVPSSLSPFHQPHQPHQTHFFMPHPQYSAYPPTQQLYSPTTGLSPATLYPTQSDQDAFRDFRVLMTSCMDRVGTLEAELLHRDQLIASLTAQLASLSAQLTQQDLQIHALQTRDTNRDIQVRTLSEQVQALQAQVADQTPAGVDPAIEARLTTIQTEVQRHSEWVDVVKKAPPAHATVSETLAETRRRSDRALNIRIRGIERADAAAPMQQAVDFVTQTMGLQDHGVTRAYRAGRDVTRPQPLIICFRDAQARLAVLRRRGRLRDHPEIHMDEDLTPMQWQEHRSLLAQRYAARAEGKWAYIRDGRLVTGTIRQAAPAPTADRPGPS